MIHRLKEVRKELGFNQTDFAKHLGNNSDSLFYDRKRQPPFSR